MVHLKATPETIRRRMKAGPHVRGVLQDADVEYVLQRFQEEYDRAVYFNRLELDTTDATPDETLAEWVRKMDPFWTEIDRLRLLTHRTEE